jgi:hypothetical protein
MASEKIAPEKMTRAGKMAPQEYRNLMQENLNSRPSEQFFDWSLYLIYIQFMSKSMFNDEHIDAFGEFFRENFPEEGDELIDYFDVNYVRGTYRRIQRPNRLLRFRHIPHRFTASLECSRCHSPR